MPDVTKRLLTDETGQSIVTALGALTNVVDPNGTTVAAAQKLNNMTVSATVLPAGATPTSSLTEVNGHFHLTLGVPVELPTVDSNDDGKFLMVEDGTWSPVSLGEGSGLMTDEEKEKLDNLGEIDIYKTIEPASIASFADGADGMPLKNLSVAIEPVQDLHGQDAPYPAGGGKNLLPLTTANLKALNTTGSWNGNVYTEAGVSYTVQEDNAGNVIGINANGTASGNSFFRLVANATVTDGSYTLNGCPTGGSAETYCQYIYTNTGYYETGKGVTTSISSTFACNIRIFGGYTVSNKTFTPMFRLSSVSDAAYAPYSNICPISGWDSANVSRTGKNLLNPANAEIGIAWNGSSNSARARLVIPIKRNVQYILSMNGTNTLDGVYSTLSNVVPPTTVKGLTLPYSFNSGENDYLILGFSKTAITQEDLDALNLQLELGSTATAYEPYQGETIEYEFPSSAGTVYGGTLTIHQDGSGELVVDRASVSFTDSTGWESVVTANIFRFDTSLLLKGNADFTENAKTSTGFNFTVYNFSTMKSNYPAFSVNPSNNRLYCAVSDSITTTEQLSSWFANNNTQLVAPLATPVTYQLTNQQVIETLKGNNVLWADAGDVTLEYPAETTGLINTYDKVKIDTIPTKVSQLQNDSGYISSNPEMTGATSEDDGTSGLVPAPSAGEEDKFLSGDGTYKSGGLPMVILSYGHSTWQDFINAYKNNVIVYCRASSNANPASGAQLRMAFMAYVGGNATTPTEVEFQYYRSMNPNNKTINQLSDQIYVYKLTSSGVWSIEVRETSLKSVVFDASSGLTGTFDKSTGTLTIAAAT